MPAREAPSETPPMDKGTSLAVERTDLAHERTMFAAERTLMAWIRTALSMIGSGFAIYKFFQVQAEELAAGTVKRPNTARNLGMTLIGLGTLALIAAVWQHRTFLKLIGASQTRHTRSVSLVVAVVVILIGFVTFYGVMLRSGPF
jgi:putative membrane protein